jgi:hypothetical protein
MGDPSYGGVAGGARVRAEAESVEILLDRSVEIDAP